MMTIYKGVIAGDLLLREGDDASEVTEVGGWLSIRAKGAELPALTSIGGWLSIRAEGAQLPALTSIGGGLVVHAEGAQLPALTSIGGWLDIRAEGAQLPALTKVRGRDLPDAETARKRLIEVAKHALVPGALDMDFWHNDSGCGTTHCIAGWAVHLAGAAGYELERDVSQPAAGNILLGAEASALFYLDNDAARAALHKVLATGGGA